MKNGQNSHAKQNTVIALDLDAINGFVKITKVKSGFSTINTNGNRKSVQNARQRYKYALTCCVP